MPYQQKKGVFDKYLTPKEERALLTHVGQFGDILAQRDAAWMTFMRHTGVRVGTLSRFSVGDAYKMLSAQRLMVEDHQAKAARGYSTYLTNKARAALKDLITLNEAMCKSADERCTMDSPLVVGRRGRALSVRSFQARMQHWRESSGLAVAATPHWFRHTLGKRVVESSTSNRPTLVAQAALGHSNERSTHVYVMPDREEVVRTMEKASHV